MIYLTLGNLELDWGKNFAFSDHSSLFRRTDIKPIAYRYIDDDGCPIVEMKEGYSSPLRHVVRRLSLLGYSSQSVALAYERLLADHLLATDDTRDNYPTFAQFAAAVAAVDVTAVSPDYESEYDHGEFFAEEIFDRLRLDTFGVEEQRRRTIGQLLEGLNPYWTLVLLASKSSNLDLAVEWGYADVAENWTGRDVFMHELKARSKFLIVTEGSSDANIIGKAFQLLAPEIADFFTFVDMEEGYPFTGTGNLHRFCQGLVSISIQNNVVVIYDNDLEGVARHTDTKALRMPSNMRVIKLPDHPSFENFVTEGPNGTSNDNINGRAAAIECYLDLTWNSTASPRIRWTAYNKVLATYHGELVDKELYARRFLKLRPGQEGYDFGKLRTVLESVVVQCSEIASHRVGPLLVEFA